MLSPSAPNIACCLCVGAAHESYLSATLASIAEVVDLLVVNDNSGLARSENLATLEASRFAASGRLRVFRHRFVDFATMRNDAFAHLRDLERPPQWVLFIDADEVHGEQLRYVAREVLPRLSGTAGQLDGYTYHFYGTPRWITDVARRLMFYRYAPELVWVNAVHEQLRGVRGKAVVVPYVYHHYGNVAEPTRLAVKHLRYYALSGATPPFDRPDDVTLAMYLEHAAEVRPYVGRHPAAAFATLAAAERELGTLFAQLDAGFRAARTPAVRMRSSLRAFNESLRVQLRRLEHPRLYRVPSRAA